MVTVRHSLAVILCLVYVPAITKAFLSKSAHPKRVGKLPGTQDGADPQAGSLSFKGKELDRETIALRYGSVVLNCAATGTPIPTIHWLKNGVRLQQDSSNSVSDNEASFENQRSSEGKLALKWSATNSRLYLDCLGEDDEATYTCVAETPMLRISQSTNLILETPEDILYTDVYDCNEKRSNRGEPARIYMWTASRLEFVNNVVQLFCRAEGNPEPNIVWYGPNDKPIENDENYTIAGNGDLVIRDLNWLENRGSYTCVADNGFGTDTTQTFVYPTQPRKRAFSP